MSQPAARWGRWSEDRLPPARGDPRRVTWVGAPPAEGDEARVVYEAPSERGASGWEALVCDVAERLYWEDFPTGGWGSDIGLFRSPYAREARKLLKRLGGRRIVVD